MTIRSVILSELSIIAEQQKRRLGSTEDRALLVDIGLDSLCFAILVARLEEKFGSDPFNGPDEVRLPVTVGDLIGMYEHASA